MAKWTSQILIKLNTLRWQSILDYSGEANRITMVLIRRRQKGHREGKVTTEAEEGEDNVIVI